MEQMNNEWYHARAEKRNIFYCLTAKFYHYKGKLARNENVDSKIKSKMNTWEVELDKLQKETKCR